MDLGQRPPVENRSLGHGRGGLRRRLPPSRAGVQGLERDDVPVGQQRLADDVLDRGVPDSTTLPGRASGGHEPADGIGAVRVHQTDRFQHVAEVLGHLASLLVLDVAEADDVSVGGRAHDQGSDGHQRVEPAAGLVDGLADEVGGVTPVEHLGAPGGMGIAPLGERHGPGVVPAVDDLGHPPRLRSAGRAGQRDVVDVGPMRVEGRDVLSRQLTQLGQRPDAGEVGLVVRAPPDRQRGAPVAVAGQRPVDVVGQPVPVAAVLDRVGVPVGSLVLREQLVLDRGRADVPGRQGVVEQRGVAPPAVRVGVLVRDVLEQPLARSQVGHQVGIGLLEELAAHEGDVSLEVPVAGHRVDHREAVRPADAEVVGAEGRGLVDQTGAVLGRHVAVQHDVVGVGDVDQVEGSGVGPALHRAPGDGLLDGPALAERGLDEGRGDHEPVGVARHDHVVDLGVGSHCGVGHERPRGRRPHQQVGPTGPGTGRQRHPDVDRGVHDGLVALGQLVVGQPGPAAWTVRRDAVVLDEQALVEDRLQRPPDALHVGRVHGAVGLGHVDPVAHPLGHRLELAHVPLHRSAAPGVELGDPVGLDVALAREPELLLHGQLHGQPVAVPAGLPGHMVPLHRPVAGEHVLEHPGLDVVSAWHPVGRGRSFVEDPQRPVLGLGQASSEDLVLAPERQDLAIDGGQVDLRGDRSVEGHGCAPSRTGLRRRHGFDEGTRLRQAPGSRGTTLLGRHCPSVTRPAPPTHSWRPAVAQR